MAICATCGRTVEGDCAKCVSGDIPKDKRAGRREQERETAEREEAERKRLRAARGK